ncbi:MAG: amidohydrolase, partial [Bdellovibrionales bacterium]|nr:amidohydrolase [Bdellovibrionales bacterium]
YRFKNHLLSPGLVNTHTHVPMSLFRGLADNLPLKEWLENYIFPLEGQFVKEDFISAGTRLSALEFIRTGVTTFCDMYFYNQVLAEAVDQSGLRGIIGVGVPSVEKDWKEWKRKARDLKDSYKNNPKIHAAIAPHAPYTVDSEVLAQTGEFAKSENFLLTIHVSESAWEQQEIQKRHNATPVQYLHRLGVTGPNSLFVHCVHVNGEDLQIMKETGTSFSYNPESNMKLSSGIAPVNKALKSGVTVGLGTDGAASNNNLNFFGEMDTGIKLQSLKGSESLTAEDMFQMATIEGARALNLEKEIGSIEVGKWADIIAINLDQPQFHPPYNLISHLVYSAQGSEVDFVMCGGQVLMENRQVKTLNEQDIYRESRDFGNRIQRFLNSS